MEVFDQLGVALGLASLAGINLYLTAFVAGLAIRFNWIDLAAAHESLGVLGNEWVLGVAGTLMVIEFFADKIPWLDSGWDAVHTIIRPAGGILLGLGALGEMDPVVLAIGGLLSGGASLTMHGAKAGTRLLLNMSPEPVSNSVASVAEDGLVIGGLTLTAFSPVIAFFVFVVILAIAVVIIRKTFGSMRAIWRGFRERRQARRVTS
ncbi:MAG: DUF4126 domain-containing protein [Akkermansiaceae bacterium]|jgi:hypothetical protein|nr:DUF4126 domain-containing protein [Akkermansiaceae bacterium]MDP4647128.1 DUF4126 domain-containing protein [Akkermansiaceae bacterium]MDP4722598.1 DUF4126 domain-containing protein [Akkermansiaceae bacterium]MDP4780422.1 DUF4126 domain-containing protein [Akkermansiaceae bacterium]MDP4847739.1 DUF4126 domain-containing protein [Akkermansiaceae bacterium]